MRMKVSKDFRVRVALALTGLALGGCVAAPFMPGPPSEAKEAENTISALTQPDNKVYGRKHDPWEYPPGFEECEPGQGDIIAWSFDAPHWMGCDMHPEIGRISITWEYEDGTLEAWIFQDGVYIDRWVAGPW